MGQDKQRSPPVKRSLPRAVFGGNILPDVRFGPDGKLYELGSDPTTGIVVSRYSL